MSTTFARMEILGRLGSDVCDHGNYASMSVIADRTVKTRDGYENIPQGFYVKAMGRTKDFVTRYVGKGDLVFIDVVPDFAQYTKRDGSTGYGSSFIINDIKLCSKSSHAPKDKDGKYLPPTVKDKTDPNEGAGPEQVSPGKKKTTSPKSAYAPKEEQGTEEYNFEEEKDLKTEETGEPEVYDFAEDLDNIKF